MRTLITLKQNEGMEFGWTHFDVEIYDTQYADKHIFNSLKMSWRPVAKTWTLSGSVKGSIDRAKKYITKKLNEKITSQNQIEIIEL